MDNSKQPSPREETSKEDHARMTPQHTTTGETISAARQKEPSPMNNRPRATKTAVVTKQQASTAIQRRQRGRKFDRLAFLGGLLGLGSYAEAICPKWAPIARTKTREALFLYPTKDDTLWWEWKSDPGGSCTSSTLTSPFQQSVELYLDGDPQQGDSCSTLAELEVKFKRQQERSNLNQSDKIVAKSMEKGLKKENGGFKWSLDEVQRDHYGTWEVEICTEDMTVLAFDLIIASDCHLFPDPAEQHPISTEKTAITSKNKESWLKLSSLTQSRATLPSLLTDQECFEITTNHTPSTAISFARDQDDITSIADWVLWDPKDPSSFLIDHHMLSSVVKNCRSDLDWPDNEKREYKISSFLKYGEIYVSAITQVPLTVALCEPEIADDIAVSVQVKMTTEESVELESSSPPGLPSSTTVKAELLKVTALKPKSSQATQLQTYLLGTDLSRGKTDQARDGDDESLAISVSIEEPDAERMEKEQSVCKAIDYFKLPSDDDTLTVARQLASEKVLSAEPVMDTRRPLRKLLEWDNNSNTLVSPTQGFYLFQENSIDVPRLLIDSSSNDPYLDTEEYDYYFFLHDKSDHYSSLCNLPPPSDTTAACWTADKQLIVDPSDTTTLPFYIKSDTDIDDPLTYHLILNKSALTQVHAKDYVLVHYIIPAGNPYTDSSSYYLMKGWEFVVKNPCIDDSLITLTFQRQVIDQDTKGLTTQPIEQQTQHLLREASMTFINPDQIIFDPDVSYSLLKPVETALRPPCGYLKFDVVGCCWGGGKAASEGGDITADIRDQYGRIKISGNQVDPSIQTFGVGSIQWEDELTTLSLDAFNAGATTIYDQPPPYESDYEPAEFIFGVCSSTAISVNPDRALTATKFTWVEYLGDFTIEIPVDLMKPDADCGGTIEYEIKTFVDGVQTDTTGTYLVSVAGAGQRLISRGSSITYSGSESVLQTVTLEIHWKYSLGSYVQSSADDPISFEIDVSNVLNKENVYFEAVQGESMTSLQKAPIQVEQVLEESATTVFSDVEYIIQDYDLTFRFKQGIQPLTPTTIFDGIPIDTSSTLQIEADSLLSQEAQDILFAEVYIDNVLDDRLLYECEPWTRERAGQVLQSRPQTLAINDYNLDSIELTHDCEYDRCTNTKAAQLRGVDDSWLPNQVLSPVVYEPMASEISVEVASIEGLYCYGSQTIDTKVSAIISPKGQPSEEITDSQELAATYGVIVVTKEGDGGATVTVWLEDHLTLETVIDVAITFSIVEEPEYAQTTYLRVTILGPPCQLTQESLTKAGQSKILKLQATQGISIDTVTVEDIFVLADEAFQILICGTYSFEILATGDPEISFLVFDEESKELTLQPGLEHNYGVYSDIYLHFKLDSDPDLVMYIQLDVTINECKPVKIEFEATTLSADYKIGDGSLIVPLPSLVSKPDCGEISDVDYSLVPLEVPEGESLSSLITFEELSGQLTVHNSTDLGLLNQKVSMKVIAVTGGGLTAEMTFEVNYGTEGPEFVQNDNFPSVISCTKADIGWSFELPPVQMDNQQEIEIILLQREELDQIFQFDGKIVTLVPMYEEQIASGALCPSFDSHKLKFEIQSDVLGSKERSFSLGIQPDESNGPIQFFFSGALEQSYAENKGDAFVEPTMSIRSIDRRGYIVIKFSDNFVIPQNLADLTKKDFEVNGIKYSNLELTVEPEEGQTAEDVKFTWKVSSYTKKELAIELSWDELVIISSKAYPNTLQVKVWKSRFFRRDSDKAQIKPVTIITKVIPQQIDKGEAAIIQLMASSVSNAGQGTMIFMFALSIAVNFSLNNVLGMIRNLSLITHLMIIQLRYPPNVVLFFAGLFEFVTFDLLPTDDIYGAIFDLDDDPYSDLADEIGYSTRNLIPNSGSTTIFLFFTMLSQLVYAIIAHKEKENGGRVYNFARKKREAFFWSQAVDILHETSLMFSYSLCINSSRVQFTSASDSFNNVFAIFIGLILFIGPILLVRALNATWSQPVTLEMLEDSNHTKVVRSSLKKSKEEKVTKKGKKKKVDPAMEKTVSFNAEAPVEIDRHDYRAKFRAQNASNRQYNSLYRVRDEEMATRFGSMIELLAPRTHLSRNAATAFILFQLYRYFALAVIVISLYAYPLAQLIFILILQVAYMVFLIQFRVYKSRGQLTQEMTNEWIVLITIYILMIFLEDFIGEVQTQRKIGLVLIVIIVINFCISLLLVAKEPILSLRMQYIRKCREPRRRRAHIRRQIKKQERLRKTKALQEQIKMSRNIKDNPFLTEAEKREWTLYENAKKLRQINNDGTMDKTQQLNQKESMSITSIVIDQQSQVMDEPNLGELRENLPIIDPRRPPRKASKKNNYAPTSSTIYEMPAPTMMSGELKKSVYRSIILKKKPPPRTAGQIMLLPSTKEGKQNMRDRILAEFFEKDPQFSEKLSKFARDREFQTEILLDDTREKMSELRLQSESISLDSYLNRQERLDRDLHKLLQAQTMAANLNAIMSSCKSGHGGEPFDTEALSVVNRSVLMDFCKDHDQLIKPLGYDAADIP